MAGGLSTYVFLLPEADLDLDHLARRLRRCYREAAVQLRASRVILRWGDWKLSVSLRTDEMTVEECQEMAEAHPKDPTWRRVSRAVGRLEVLADEDPEERFYNQWLLVSEWLGSQVGMLALDPMLGEWLGGNAPGAPEPR